MDVVTPKDKVRDTISKGLRVPVAPSPYDKLPRASITGNITSETCSVGDVNAMEGVINAADERRKQDETPI